jgi:tetratricopeptide (TPR) repeat protein
LKITTAKLCEDVIKPATLTDRCAFLDTLRGETDSSGKPSVGRATVFVSHAWRYRVVDVIDTILDFAKESPDGTAEHYFWVDIFVNNQHAEGLDHPFEWWCSTFKDNIAAIGKVLLVMTPWDAPIPLTRAWCLWEIFCALELEQDGKAQLIVRLPANQRTPFFSGVIKGPGRALEALAAVDVEKAQAHSAKDLDSILNAVRGSIGCHRLNTDVIAHLREWFLATTVSLAKQLFDSSHQCFGDLMFQFGQLEEALGFYHRTLQWSVERLGPGNKQAAMAHEGIARVSTIRGQYDTALAHAWSALTIQRHELDRPHVNLNVATTYVTMASAHQGKGEHGKAMELYDMALAIYQANLRLEHPTAGAVYGNMAIIHLMEKRYDEALECLHKDLHIKMATLGETHCDTAVAHGNMGKFLLDSQGEHDKALEHYDKALTIQLATLGSKHYSLVNTYNGMAKVYQSRGQHDQALELYNKAVRILTLSGEVAAAAATYRGMAEIYSSRDQHDKALDYHHKALDILMRTVGERHVSTLCAYGSIGGAHFLNGDKVMARSWLQRAVDALSGKLDPDDSDFKTFSGWLAVC